MDLVLLLLLLLLAKSAAIGAEKIDWMVRMVWESEERDGRTDGWLAGSDDE